VQGLGRTYVLPYKPERLLYLDTRVYGSPLTKTQPVDVRSGASKREKNKPLQIQRLNRVIGVLEAKETEVRGWGIGSRIDP